MRKVCLFLLLVFFGIGIVHAQSGVVFKEDFNELETGIPKGWSNSDNNLVSDYGNWKRSSNGYSGSCVMFSSDLGYSALKTPVFNLGMEKALSIKSRIVGGSLSVYVSTDGGETYRDNLVGNIDMSSEWIETGFSLSSYSGSVCLVFVANGDPEKRNTGIFLDDVVVSDIPLCGKPVNITLVSADDVSADIVWTVSLLGGIPESYILNVRDKAGNPIKDNEKISGVYNYRITGLSANTEYQVTLKSVCSVGKGESVVSDPLSFKTECAAEAIPYYNDFDAEAGAVPECWSVAGDITLQKDPSGIQNNRVVKLVSSVSDGAYLYTPQLDFASDDMQLTMKIYGSKGTGFKVLVGENAFEPYSFMPVYNGVVEEDKKWSEVTVFTKASYLGAQKNAVLCVQVESGKSATLYIDEFRLDDAPDCLAPFGLRLDNVSDNSFTVDWDEYKTVGRYEIKFVDESGSEYTSSATAKPHTVTGEGLKPDSKYTVSVRAVCGDDVYSGWSDAITVSTICSVAESPGFIEGFEDTEFPPKCWFQRQTVGGQSGAMNRGDNAWVRSTSAVNVYEGKGVMACPRQYAGIRSIIVPQAFTLTEADRNKWMVSFYMKRVSNSVDEALQVWVNSRPDTVGGTKLGRIYMQCTRDPQEVRGAGWYRYEFDIPQVGFVYVMLEAICEYGTQPFLIDNFEVKRVPDCRKVKDIKLIEPFDRSAGISWTPLGSETEWTVDYKLTCEDGSVIENTGVKVQEPKLIVDELKSTSRYTFAGSVSASCGDDISERVDFEYKFTTPCPWYEAEGFKEDFEGDKFPSECWSMYSLSGNKLADENDKMWKISGDMPCGGKYSAKYYAYSNDNGSLLVTPVIDVPDDTETYRLYLSVYKSRLFGDGDVMRIWSNSTVSLEGAVLLGEFYGKTTLAPVVGNDGEYHRFFVDLTEKGRQYLMFEVRGNSGTPYYIDDIVVEKASQCEVLDNFAVNSVLNNSVKVMLYDNSVSEWEVSYAAGDGGFNPEDGTILPATGSECIISGLKSGTQYTVYARSVCNGVKGGWSRRAITFSTLCDPLKITGVSPLFEGFEGMPANDVIGGCWLQDETNMSAKYADVADAFMVVSAVTADIVPADGNKFAVMKRNGSDNWLFRYVELEAGTDYEMSVLARYVDPDIYRLNPRISFVYGHLPNKAGVDKFIVKDTVVNEEWTEVMKYFTVPESGKYFVGINISDNVGYSLMAIDNFSVKTCNCRMADKMYSDRVTNSSAEITVVSDRADAFNFKVSDNPEFDPNTQDGNIATEKESLNRTLSLKTLRPNTVYYYSAQCVCADGYSDWMKVQSFETQCDPVGFPYNEDFEGGESSVNCWTLVAGNAEVSSYQAHESIYSYAFERNAMSVSPELEVESLADYMVSGWVFSKTAGTRVGIGVMSDHNDIATYTELGSFDVYESGVWIEFVTYFSALNGPGFSDEQRSSNRVVLSVTGDIEMKPCFIDDLKIDWSPSCPRPTEPKILNVTSTAATISWTANGEESSWIISAVDSRGEQILEKTVYENPAVVDGLQPAQYYMFEMKAVCSDENSGSAYIGETRTLCDDVTLLPYYEDFEGISNIVRGGEYCFSFLWNKVEAGKDPRAEMSSRMTALQGAQSLRIYNHKDTALYVVMPAFAERTAALRMEFDYENVTEDHYNDDLIIGVMTDVTDENTFRQLTVCPKKNVMSHYRVAFDSLDIPAGYENARIVVKYGPNIAGYSGRSAVIDNLFIERIPDCVEPRDIYIEALQDRSAKVRIDGNNAVAWQYAVGLSGFDPDAEIPVGTDKNVFVIENLEPRTYYDLYVRTDCAGKGYSQWIGPVAFRTNCLWDMPVGWTESFETLETIDDGCFFIRINGKTGRSKVRVVNNGAYVSDGRKAMKVTLGRAETGDPRENIYIALPHFAEPLQFVRLYFDYLNFGTFDNKGDFSVGVMSDLDNVLSFKEVKRFSVKDDYDKRMEREVIDFESFFVDNKLPEAYNLNGHIVLRFNNFEAAHGNSGFAADSTHFAIDNIRVVGAGFCDKPENIAVDAIMDTEARFKITHLENITSFIYEVFLDGNKVADGKTDNGSITVTSLMPKTSYLLRVRTVCADGVYSDLYDELPFTTLPSPAKLPYMCDFEQDDENQEWVFVGETQNKLIVGDDPAAQNNASGRSLYVSYNDDTYGYYTNTASVSAAYRSVWFDAGVHIVSFDWKCLGEIPDYGRVFVVPASVEVEPGMVGRGNDPDGGFSADGRKALYGSAEWQTSVAEITVIEPGIYKFVVQWSNNSSGGEAPALAVDNLSIVPVECDAVENIEVISVGDTEVSVSFDNLDNSASTDWLLCISDDIENPIRQGTVAAGADNFVVSSLLPSSTYWLFLRSSCSAGLNSSWRSVSFKTEKTAAQVPYSTGFEDDKDNDCWTVCGSGKSGTFIFGSSPDVKISDGNKALYFHDDAESGHFGDSWSYTKNAFVYGTYRFYSYRMLTFTPGQYYISYDWKCEGIKGEDYGRAYLVPTNVDVSFNSSLYDGENLHAGIISLDGGKEMSGSVEEWTKEMTVVDIDAETRYKLVFMYQADLNGNYSGGRKPLAIDNVRVEPLECGIANNITVKSVSDTDVDIEFSNISGGEVSYALGTVKDRNKAERSGIEPGAVSLHFDNLEPNTTYWLFLSVRCSDGKESPVSEFSFTTMPAMFSLPLQTGFEDTEDNSIWVFDQNGTRFIIGDDTAAVRVGKKSLYLSSYPNTTGKYEYTRYEANSKVFASFHVEHGEYIVSYDWRCTGNYNDDYGRVFLAPTTYVFRNNEKFDATTLPDGFIPLDGGQPLLNSSAWKSNVSTFTVEKPENYNLVIYWHNDNFGVGKYPLAVDNLYLGEYTCRMVGNLRVTDIEATTAVVRFDNANDSKRVEYSLGLTPDITDSYLHGTSENGEIILSGVKPDALNYLFVTSVCGEDDKSPVAVVAFRSYCDDIMTVTKESIFDESFESHIDGYNLDGCWIETLESGDNRWIVDRSERARTGDYNIRLGARTTNRLIHPFRLQSGKLYHFSAWVRYAPETANISPKVDAVIGHDGSFLTLASVLPDKKEYKRIVVEFQADHDGVFELGFLTKSSEYDDNSQICIDDILLKEISLTAPQNLRLKSVGQTDVTLGWDDNADRYQVRIINDGGVVKSLFVDDPEAIVGGLQASMSYTAQVRGILVADRDTSDWAEIDFSTGCGLVELPFLETFDKVETGLPACWNNTNESQLQDGFDGNWFVDRDNRTGNRYAAVNTNRTLGYAVLKTPDLFIEDDTYRIRFKYRANIADSEHLIVRVTDDNGVSYPDTLLFVTESTEYDAGTGYRWVEKQCSLSEFAGKTVSVAFETKAIATGIGTFVNIDDIRIYCFGTRMLYEDKICWGKTYSAYGFEVKTDTIDNHGGVFEYTRISEAVAIGQCDTVKTLRLTINPAGTFYRHDTVCPGDVYLFDGNEYMESTTIESMPAVTSCGCDSTLRVYLTVAHRQAVINDTICDGETYQFGNRNLIETGIYRDTIPVVGDASPNCSTVTTLNLVVLPKYFIHADTVCQGQSIVWQGDRIDKTDRYEKIFTNRFGCDSIEVMNLWVIPDETHVYSTVCKGMSEVFNGKEYTESGDYRANLVNCKGCDSIAWLHLTVTEPNSSYYTDWVCEDERYVSYGFDVSDITRDTLLSRTTSTVFGCDSVVQVQVVFRPSVNVDTTVTIIRGQTYDFGENTLSEPGRYTGKFATAGYGCDSVVNLYLQVISGIDNVYARPVVIAPNPILTGQTAYVDKTWNPDEKSGMSVEIINSLGQIVSRGTPRIFPIVVGPLPVSGIYYVRITSGSGDVYVGKLIVK